MNIWRYFASTSPRFSASSLSNLPPRIDKTKRNLRDSMGNLELAITNLAEVTANEIHHKNNSYGLEKLKDDVVRAGKITGKTRKDIEQEIGKKVVDETNYKTLTNTQTKNLPKK